MRLPASLRLALLVAAKDLRIEWRSRVLLAQIFPLVVAMLFMFGFSLGPSRSTLAAAAPGVVWIAVLFSCVLAAQRGIGVEAGGGMEVLRMLAGRGAAAFLGKCLAVSSQVLFAALLTLAGVLVLFAPSVRVSLAWLSLGVAGAASVFSLSAAALVLTATALGSASAESLTLLLFLPTATPALISMAKLTSLALAGAPAGRTLVWLALSIANAVLWSGLGPLSFRALLEDGL
jgi:heme exporter protein B